ncbi:hypothetical protein GCM10007049_34590 [Echinicola pacifica]|uniref:Transglutaminase-like domain-containing protein n=1 Tax=Echinicola pacifica TaxID=346377 RepID=A0A918Q9N1_9BACT|nr:transglutaminase family protein [Echinicola pacifica]GGZ38521.1 hypothetical protein GCM10007049_34590 [Echinicola pacifica]
MNIKKRLRIKHWTAYTYDSPVELTPQKILLSPSTRRHVHILSHKTEFLPHPQGVNQRLDMEGNLFQQIWFNQKINYFEINNLIELTTSAVNPFEFIIEKGFEQVDQFGNITFHYTDEKKTFLSPYLIHQVSSPIRSLSAQYLNKSDGVVDFMVKITAHLHQVCDHIIRDDPGIWEPEKTLKEEKGSCRDLAWLLIMILRAEGIASRFVSGYAYNPELDENHELHAWVEAYCPGAGWIGLDPSLGLLTDHGYIPLSASYLAHLTLPVIGTFSGIASSNLESTVEIKEF